METKKEILLKLNSFLNEVSNTGEVWALENKVGFATTQSTIYADQDGKPIFKLCFWDSEEKVKQIQSEEWKEYDATSFPLGEFLEQWCVGIANEGYHIEINLDNNYVGYEIHPLELAMIIIEKLQETNASVPLQHYVSLQDFYEQIKHTIQ
ncbi:DUF2750 domain-containing protein [Halosquirtibacter laminarini]|uniref:DUF2750 domain-containing protein n=1 Tax=Halosquirtibacter laminarini TaxID=3374600 RepID=A0AC61NGU8_9BACT|nr:DUF2750 domain-containing protein [Prolixibacteraceae bacterium]